MSSRNVITDETIIAALSALDERIAHPPPEPQRKYSRREAFMKLRIKAQAALAAGHSLETVLDDLKGIGLELAVSTARQYLKPGKRQGSSQCPETEAEYAGDPAIGITCNTKGNIHCSR